MPSPDVVCSSRMTWPLFSPPRTGPGDLHPLEDVLVADRRPDDLAAGRLDDRLEPAVREDRHDEAAARQRVAGQPVEGEDAEDLVAVDDPAVGVDRDEPVGVAIEREADIRAGRDDRLGERRRVRSRRSRTLMLTPSGAALMTSSRAPVAARISGPTTEPEPFAASRTRCRWRASIGLGEAEPVDPVVGQPARGVDHPAEVVVRAPPSSSVRQMSVSSSSSIESSSLSPSRVEDLEPVVGGRVVRGGDHDPGRERARRRR